MIPICGNVYRLLYTNLFSQRLNFTFSCLTTFSQWLTFSCLMASPWRCYFAINSEKVFIFYLKHFCIFFFYFFFLQILTTDKMNTRNLSAREKWLVLMQEFLSPKSVVKFYTTKPISDLPGKCITYRYRVYCLNPVLCQWQSVELVARQTKECSKSITVAMMTFSRWVKQPITG